MDIRTFKAKSMHEAIGLIRAELGPDAALLHTREVSRGWLGWLAGAKELEVTASAEARIPSRLGAFTEDEADAEESIGAVYEDDSPNRFSHRPLHGDSHDTIDDLMRESADLDHFERDTIYLDLAADLLETGFLEETINDLIDDIRPACESNLVADVQDLKAAVATELERHLRDGGPLAAEPGHPLTIAIVGPTGVGKTTTLAKSAAQYRLKKRCRVGMITVDTYRIAAVEQLRTYADLMDLPMEVVSSPREMRAAPRMQGLDLVLIDTAGEVRATPRASGTAGHAGRGSAHEIHLVLSAVADLGDLPQIAADVCRDRRVGYHPDQAGRGHLSRTAL